MMKQDTQMQIEESMERIYDRFDAAWVGDEIPQVENFLPVGLSSEEQRKVLLELVLIDLEKRWQRFHTNGGVTSEIAPARAATAHHGIPSCPLLEDYCRRYPELGAVGQLSNQAIAHEYRVRSRAGVCPPIDEYTRRFPNRATELMTIFAGSGSNRELNATDTGSVNPSEETIIEPPSKVKDSASTPPIEDGIEISSLRSPIPELADGQVFGRYRIEGTLGRGGMGAVYRAYDSHLHRTVALKVPFFKRGYSEEIVQRFLREARAVAQLSHANLCRIFDVGVIEGTLFLTMEFVEGQSLEQLFKLGKPMPEADVVPVIRQVALALQEAHDCGIIHRDLKPANIMRNTKGQPVLMDFGLARHIDSEENDLTKDGALLGTPAYMSPEQIRGTSREIGPATDIYSLGVVMYRLLTGCRPFEGTFTAILSAIPTAIPTAPRDLCRTIHPTIEAICLKAMAKSCSDRFASAAEMAAALDQALQTPLTTVTEKRVEFKDETTQSIRKPDASDTVGSKTATGTWWQERNARVIGGVVAVAAVMLFVAWSNRGTSPSPRPGDMTQRLSAASMVLESDQTQSTSSASSTADTKPVAAVASSKNVAAVEKLNGKRIEADPILETHLQRAQQQLGFEVLSQKSLPLHAKDKLQFHVTLSAPSYVYLYLIDTNGMPNRLWPETPQDLQQQQPVTELWAPSLAAKGQKQKMYFLDDLQGQETVLVATSRRPLSHADLQTVETVRLNLTHVDGSKQQLVSFRREDRERGFGGIVETDKALSVEIDRFTERLSRLFDGYTGIVFPHE